MIKPASGIGNASKTSFASSCLELQHWRLIHTVLYKAGGMRSKLLVAFGVKHWNKSGMHLQVALASMTM
jgi:hypothetical protein